MNAAGLAATHTTDSHSASDGWMDGEAAGSEGSATSHHRVVTSRRDEEQINYPNPRISGTPADVIDTALRLRRISG